MEEEILDENYKGSIELLGDGFKIMKNNWFKVLLIYLIQAVPMCYITYVKYHVGVSVWAEELLSVINSILSGVSGIIITLIVLKSFDNHIDYKPIDILKKTWILCWTQFLLIIIIAVPSVLLFVGGMYALTRTDAYTLMIPLGIVYILLMAYIAIKTVFITQAVTISNKKYWSAIKWSWQKSSEHVGTIFGIAIVPLMILALSLGLVQQSMYSLTSIIVLMLVSLLMGLIMAVSITLLYIEEEMEVENYLETNTGKCQ